MAVFSGCGGCEPLTAWLWTHHGFSGHSPGVEVKVWLWVINSTPSMPFSFLRLLLPSSPLLLFLLVCMCACMCMHTCLSPCRGHSLGYRPSGPIHLEFCSCLSLFCWWRKELMTWHVNGSHRPACRRGFSPHSMLFQGWTQNLRCSPKHLYLMSHLPLLSLLKPCLSLAWGFQSRLG